MKPYSTVLFIVTAVMVFSSGASPSALDQASDQNPQETNADSKLGTDQIDDDRPAARSADSREQNRNRRTGNRGFDPKQLFDRLDRNQDGKLSLDEMPEPMWPRMKPLFERLGKEVLNQEEFARAMASRFGPPRGRGRPQAGRRTEGNRERGDRERGERPDDRDGDRTRGERRPGGMGSPAFFRLLDENHDGQLNKKELSKAAEKLLELDRNKDGHLDLRELFGGGPQSFRGPFGPRPGFRPAFEGPGGDPRPGFRFRFPFRRPGGGPSSDARRPDEAFRERRRPDDSVQPRRGNSNRSPAGDAQRSRSRGPGSPGFVEGLLKRLDKNSDGKLSKAESSERLLEGFSRIDGNKDGSLDLQELRSAFSRRSERDTQRERPERNPEEKEGE